MCWFFLQLSFDFRFVRTCHECYCNRSRIGPIGKITSAGGIFRSDARAFADDEVLWSQSTWLSSTWIYYWLPSMCSFSETWSFFRSEIGRVLWGEETWRVVSKYKGETQVYIMCTVHVICTYWIANLIYTQHPTLIFILTIHIIVTWRGSDICDVCQQ